MFINKKREGFTLIEVLVVISIIGLLASSSVYSFNLSRAKASDVQELAALDQVMKAVEMYYDDEGDYFVTNHYNCWIDYKGSNDVCIDCSKSGAEEFLLPLQEKGYFTKNDILRTFGNDTGYNNPVNSNYRSCFLYTIDKTEYKFIKRLYDTEKMKNDGGISNEVYEVGSDLGIPWIDADGSGVNVKGPGVDDASGVRILNIYSAL